MKCEICGINPANCAEKQINDGTITILCEYCANGSNAVTVFPFEIAKTTLFVENQPPIAALIYPLQSEKKRLALNMPLPQTEFNFVENNFAKLL